MPKSLSSKTSRFLTPKRRLTRQKSGFNVSGKGLGSTCRIEQSELIRPVTGQIDLEIIAPKLPAYRLFKKDLAILGVGAYLNPDADAVCLGTLSWKQNSQAFTKNLPAVKLARNKWNRYGVLSEIPLGKNSDGVLTDVTFTVHIDCKSTVSVFAPIAHALSHKFFIENDVYNAFSEKTSLYIPEILYIDPCLTKNIIRIVKGVNAGVGQPIVCKSCNRCNRYQPVDINDERNTLSYSNHCVSRAPCSHAAFSRYEIISGDKSLLNPKFIVGNQVVTHYGHQLECIVCKKFFVNLPLNPLRNSTQHREDSLRRRATEILVAELLGKKWVYHEHRIATGTEFDVHIWEKFGKKCFKCGVKLKTANDMDLDHTLPLAYLWPLDSTATCLCSSCNSSKSDKFPIEFYQQGQLEDLAKITGILLKQLKSRPINTDAVERLLAKIQWFFDIFLANKDYQKVRDGKKAADLIVNALQNALTASGIKKDLVTAYIETTGRPPKTVNLKP